ncbi:MAG: DUF1080 domain-containing protein [Pirellulales bacterium]
MRRQILMAAALILAAQFAVAVDNEAFTDPAKAGPDFQIQGEYEGTLKTPDQEIKAGAQVIALGDGKFRGVFLIGGLPGSDWHRGDPQLSADSETVDGVVTFNGDGGSAKIADGKLVVTDPSGTEMGTLSKVERKSSTLGAKPPEGAKVLFDGTSAALANWAGGKLVEDNLLLAGTRSKDEFQDFSLHMEFRTPFVPKATGQARGNSGLYLQDRYEVQILDSFGLDGANNECGGFYSIKEPAVNMCYPPLSWQTYDIDFKAATFDGETKTTNARVTIKHNGETIYDDFELPNLTPGGAAQEYPGKGPLSLQAHGNPVTYRNIWIVEK